jgi:hypothetical protein
MSCAFAPCSDLLGHYFCAHDDQVELLPAADVPSDLLSLYAFLCAGVLALTITALLVLLIENNSNGSSVPVERQPQLGSCKWRVVGLSEKERE